MMRDDITTDLVHWTKGESDDKALEAICSITSHLKIHGNSSEIKGGFNCVCFSEAPSGKFHREKSRYKPFGIKISKSWLYGRGGRPVIYQSNEEYGLLNEKQRWRHVRYEPLEAEPIDFTWEREWRIKTDCLALEELEFSIIVPDESWVKRIYSEKAHLFTYDFDSFWFPNAEYEKP
jgi:hypothetical protein